jgi:hypothetical protein
MDNLYVPFGLAVFSTAFQLLFVIKIVLVLPHLPESGLAIGLIVLMSLSLTLRGYKRSG